MNDGAMRTAVDRLDMETQDVHDTWTTRWLGLTDRSPRIERVKSMSNCEDESDLT